MSAAAFAGWALAAAALTGLLVSRHRVSARREAVARACHELSGPLTTVRLGLSLSTGTGALSVEHLAAIDSELGRATLALEDLTRVRTGAPAVPPARLERVSLAPLLADAVTAGQGRAALLGCRLSGGWEAPEAIVWGDRRRLVQALDNLVANAIEHGGGEVRVHGSRRGARIQIVVDDAGPGLPATVAVIARRPRRGRGRRGRGLAIALAAAELHGGTVTAGPVGAGGRVVLELPAAPRPVRVARSDG